MGWSPLLSALLLFGHPKMTLLSRRGCPFCDTVQNQRVSDITNEHTKRLLNHKTNQLPVVYLKKKLEPLNAIKIYTVLITRVVVVRK